jgi:hypothetical protein
MKIKCIYNISYDTKKKYDLTISKTYDAISDTNINDKYYYNTHFFKSLSKYRNEQIDKLLEE